MIVRSIKIGLMVKQIYEGTMGLNGGMYVDGKGNMKLNRENFSQRKERFPRREQNSKPMQKDLRRGQDGA